jgi:hypothetical protein
VFVIDRTLEIDAPAAVVWQVITDLPAYGEWNPFVPECRSSLKPGERIEMQVRLGKRLSRQVEWMTGFDEGRGFSYRMKPVPFGALSSAREHRIESLEANRCRYHTHFELRGWLMPLVRKLMEEDLAKGFSGMTQGIKRRSESLWAQQQG